MILSASRSTSAGVSEPSFSLAKSSQAEKFQEVGAVLRVGVEQLRANVSDDRFELVECWRQPDGFLALRGAQMRRR